MEARDTHIPHAIWRVHRTLQDVAILMGLRVNSQPIIGRTYDNWPEYVGQILGVIPGDEAFHGSRLRLTWLNAQIGNLEQHDLSDPVVATCCARAYIMRLLGGVLVADHSVSYVSLRYLTLSEDFTVTA